MLDNPQLLQNCNISFSHFSFIVETKNFLAAKTLVLTEKHWLALTALKFSKEVAIVRFPGCRHPFEIPAYLALENLLNQGDSMNNIEFPGLYLGQEIKIYSSNFLRTLLNLLENKDNNSGLVRLNDNVQLVLTHGSAISLGVADASPYTNLRREDYWFPADLESFNREWRQQLREDGTNSIEFSYLALDDPLNDQQEKLNWVRCTSRYRLLKDGNQLYHQAQCLDFVPVPRPVLSN